MNNRPYVICHILSSLDGRISGRFFNQNETLQAAQHFALIRENYHPDAIMNGAVTCSSLYTNGYVKHLPHSVKRYPRNDHIVKQDLSHYVVCIDLEGTLNFTRNTITRAHMSDSHIIEVVGHDVSDDYLAFLNAKKISYIFAGKDTLDVATLLDKLNRYFGIETVMVTGGGVMDYALIEADCLDEFSLVLAPVISGEMDVATAFDDLNDLGAIKTMVLKNVSQLDGGALWLQYVSKGE